MAAYRDALRLLVLFASKQTGKKPCAFAVANLDRDMILAYLDHLERSLGKGRKQRAVPLASNIVAAIESLLRERGIARHEHVPQYSSAPAESV